MSVKYLDVVDVGRVAIYRRKGVKSLKLSVAHDGTVRLSMPIWTPYKVGLNFIGKNRQWIVDHTPDKTEPFSEGLHIGKAHSLHFISSDSSRVSQRVIGTDIRVFLARNMTYTNPAAQEAAKKGAIKALKTEAERLLPERLDYLAKAHGFNYASVKIKQLKSRWGSCNEKKHITLSLYLMQLPWELIDYVILHELTHTKVLAHGAPFWGELDRVLPGSKQYKKEINKYKPTIITNNLKI